MADAKTEKQKVKEITDKLEEGLKELFDSEQYKTYLSTMSKFHNYSVNNTLLITMQMPDASLVAGYKAWQKNFGRHVNKGEKAIRILAPAPYKIKEERDKLDPVTGEPMIDESGMPQKEEVEVTIPAFQVVSVFDVSQTDGKPLPDLGAEELISTVEGYEDFKQAVMNVSPVPVGFEDIPGEAKGYYSVAEKRIAVQEDMSESQTLKTMIHETAHAMLHDRDVNRADVLDQPLKDRNTKEVEAESVAYTVCQHFGIDTSDYSFGYIAGWSSDKDMKELKSSLDTIRKTASELITGIETQLQELQRDREMMQAQEKESILLVQNDDLSEYSLLSVRGMDAREIVAALSTMSEDDKLSVAAYLESKGAWTAEIANEQTKEFGEHHLDVRYNTDTNEIIDFKAELDIDERAKEPIGANDVILKITHASGFEVERITNKTPEEVLGIMTAITRLEDKNINSIHECLENQGADYIPIIVSGGRNSEAPQFNDYEMDLTKNEVVMAHHLSAAKQAEGFINRLEFSEPAFSDDERNLIINYAHKLNDMEKTRELAEHIYYEEAYGNQGAALAVIDAQAEIDALPDPMIGLSEMEEYGYTWNEMLPLTKEKALELFDHDLPVYRLYDDGAETLVEDRQLILNHEGIFGIEKSDWENERNFRSMQEELSESTANKEMLLIYGNTDKYGIYQLKDSPELHQYKFGDIDTLQRLGLLNENLDEIKKENYELIYTGELADIGGNTQDQKLEEIYKKFNLDHPEDFRGHSLSVSDVVVLHQDGETSSHYVDSVGYTELPNFMRELEEIKEQDAELNSGQDMIETVQNDVGQPESVRENGDEIIDLGDDREQVLEDLKKTLDIGQEAEEIKELAISIADRFISIQESDEGYDYSIMGTDYKIIEGGFYDDPDVSIREALDDIIDDLKNAPHWNGAAGNIGVEDDIITQIDYDELLEKVENANRIEPPRDVVAEFKEKTNELFHDISELNPAEIEETVKCHVQAVLDETGIEAVIVDAAVVGSRSRGLERYGSDLDVVVELSTNEREDVLFDAFNESGLMIGGIKVDINPITAERTGTLETYLPQVEEYLAGVREAREQEPKSIFSVRMNNEERFYENTSGLDADALCKAYGECELPFVEMGKYGKGISIEEFAEIQQSAKLGFSVEFDADNDEVIISDGKNFEHKGLEETVRKAEKEVEITLLVSECGEFHNLGEFHENIATVEEAIAIWKQIPPERMNGQPAIGINLHRQGEESYKDEEIDLVSRHLIDLEVLEYVPSIASDPKAIEVIAELIVKLPEIEVRGNLSEELQSRIHEIRQAEDPGYKLAAEIDQFVYDYDPYEYRSAVTDREEGLNSVYDSIKNGDVDHISAWLNEVISEGADQEDIDHANELIDKLKEYKPLAKVEELEEQNYNMIDDVINNGGGEKAQREAIKKEQEQPAARTSLKARLAEKKAELAGQQGHDAPEKENTRNKREEI